VKLPHAGKFNVTDAEFQRILLSPERFAEIIRDNQERLLEWAESEVTTSDIVALGYRRKQLERFRRMLSEPNYFAAERADADKSEEAMWQLFFEENKWVFGYGLSYFFMSSLEGRGLEQTIAARSPESAQCALKSYSHNVEEFTASLSRAKLAPIVVDLRRGPRLSIRSLLEMKVFAGSWFWPVAIFVRASIVRVI
jgi:hypothetical protein